MEIPLLRRNTPSGRDLNPSLDPRRGISREHNPLHTEPTVTKLLRNKKQRHKTMANNATRRSRKELR